MTKIGGIQRDGAHIGSRSKVKMGQFASKKNSTCDAVGELDLVCQLKRHHILNFGQRNGILTEDELRTSIRSFTEKYKNLNAWKGDDTTADGSLLPRWLPAIVRNKLLIPRCMNTRSVYVFLVLDCLLVYLFVKTARLCARKIHGPKEKEEDNWREVIIKVCAVTAVAVSIKVVFEVLHWQWKWIEKPHLVFTVIVTAYLFGSRFDAITPDW